MLFGVFDEWKDWEMELELEAEFMEKFGWAYQDDNNGKEICKKNKGCIAKLVSWQKNQFVKMSSILVHCNMEELCVLLDHMMLLTKKEI